MEIISEKSTHIQIPFDAMEPDLEVQSLENIWSNSFLHLIEPQVNSMNMLEMIGCHGSPNVAFLRDMAESIEELHHPVSVSTDIQPSSSCQPYDEISSKRAFKMPTHHDVKIEEGCLLDEELPSSILINQTPQFSLSQTYLSDNAVISRSSVNEPSLEDCLGVHNYGGGEICYLYGETTSNKADIFQPDSKSLIEGASSALDSSESSASNELLCSSEMQQTDNLFDQKTRIKCQMYGMGPMLEDPFASIPMLRRYANDKCTFDEDIEELPPVDDKNKTVSQVCEGLEVAPHILPGCSEFHPVSSSREIILEEASKDRTHPRIDFEGSLVQSQMLATPEGKVLIEGSSVTSKDTQFCLPRPISGLFSHVNKLKNKSYVVNNGLNAGPSVHTCASGNEVLDRYRNRKRQLNEMQETSIVQSCCSFATMEGSSPLQSASSKDSVDECHGKVRDLEPIVKKFCTQSYGRRMMNDGLEIGLMHLVTACADAVARRDTCLASVILARLEDMVSCSNSTMKRVLAYFIQALEHLSKAVKDDEEYEGENAPSQGDQLAAFQILHEIFPYIKFGHFTANQAILEVVQGSSRVHIVDFEILEGIQWPAFMQALVSRNGAPPALHITAVCRPQYGSAMVHKTCKRLKEFASSIRLRFSYSLLKFDEGDEGFDAGQIEILQGETLVVNCMVHLPHMPRHNMARIAIFLQVMQSFSPAVVTLVEEELGCSPTAAASYLSEALYHFNAFCDSLEACLPSQVEGRMLVERVFLESSIKRTISLWNQTVSPRASYGLEVSNKYKWSTIMYAAGFKPIPLSFHNQSQAKLLLGLHKDGFELEERGHHLVLGWHEKPLYAASVWK